ncbi:uncharacterized protein LOC114277332 [Camellia sinensis]|uniref:uncharacterized protein LOC114277332 n=1 Tax=Camellia sinensis TaxID=4442 RepID=UPI0010360471|nr:uncharacterized protein LOC114277332 [Camellia sinensis]
MGDNDNNSSETDVPLNSDGNSDDDSDGDSDDDFVFPHLANDYANPVKMRVSSIDLSNDEDTKSNEENDDQRMREVTDSAIRRVFREDESRWNASLTAETATRLHSGEQIVLGYIQNSDGNSDDDSDGNSDDDFVFPHLANDYANPVKMRVSSIDLSNDKDTKSNEENDDQRMREVTDSAIWRVFREDESRWNAPLTTETAARVMEGWGPRILYWTKAPNFED